jgi:hypothetical protein
MTRPVDSDPLALSRSVSAQLLAVRWPRVSEQESVVVAPFLHFPQCAFGWQVEFYDSWTFYAESELTKFIRETTAAERDAGITYSHAAVIKEGDRISRLYGHSSLLN